MQISVDTLLPPDGSQRVAPTDAERAQIALLVQQFEGMLLTEMLRGIGGPEPDEEEDSVLGLGGSTLTDMTTAEFGLALSKAGGLGLGDVLAAALARQRGLVPDVSGLAGLPARPGARDLPAIGLGTVSPAPAVPAVGPPEAAVTSPFGWRLDPLNGQPRFHAGTDLRAAYGSEVRALAGGTVSFAGDRKGYGLTVTIDHGAGRQSLYAHLSAANVRPGDTIDAGQGIARSGNSGRSTGPHLHLEAREHGRPVDLARLADWMGDGRATPRVGETTSE